MKLGRIVSAIVAGSAVALGSVALTAATASATTASLTKASLTTASDRATARLAPVVVLDCLSKPRTEPRDFILTCADGNAALNKLAWTSWTATMASAAGTLTENDCIPYCAAGHFHNYPVLVVLWRPVSYHHGQRFSELTMIFTGTRPRVYNGHKWMPGPVTTTGALWGPLKA